MLPRTNRINSKYFRLSMNTARIKHQVQNQNNKCWHRIFLLPGLSYQCNWVQWFLPKYQNLRELITLTPICISMLNTAIFIMIILVCPHDHKFYNSCLFSEGVVIINMINHQNSSYWDHTQDNRSVFIGWSTRDDWSCGLESPFAPPLPIHSLS